MPVWAAAAAARTGLASRGGSSSRTRRGGTDRRELRVGGEKTSLGGDVEGEKKEIELTERSGAVKINKRLSACEMPFVPVGHSNRD